MILIPDRNTLAVIKEGNFSIEDIRLRVMTDNDYTDYEISFDGGKFHPFRKGMRIPEQYYSLRFIQFRLRCKSNGQKLQFTSERMPLKVYTMLGDKVEDLYPIAIQKVLDMEQGIKEKIEKLDKRLRELEELGEI